MGLNAVGFVGRADMRVRDLARLGKQGYEAELRRWVQGEVGRLPAATLADPFKQISHTHTNRQALMEKHIYSVYLILKILMC